jgi:hypothetical protein
VGKSFNRTASLSKLKQIQSSQSPCIVAMQACAGSILSLPAGGICFSYTVALGELPADIGTIVVAGSSESGLRRVISKTICLNG